MSLEEKIQHLVNQSDRRQIGLPVQVSEDAKKVRLFPDTVQKYAPVFEARVALLVWEVAYKKYTDEKGPVPFATFRDLVFKTPKNLHYYSDTFAALAETLPREVTVEDLELVRQESK